ncbi:MAG: hypothetical protein IPK08_19660 [Bacteroidetes bacterium]|nr:hypothetical protein [Bacteroidota bacterium]
MYNYLKEYTSNDVKIDFDAQLREAFPGEPQAEIDSLQSSFNRIIENLKYSINIVDSASYIFNADPSKYSPDNCIVYEYIMNQCNMFKTTFNDINITVRR